MQRTKLLLIVIIVLLCSSCINAWVSFQLIFKYSSLKFRPSSSPGYYFTCFDVDAPCESQSSKSRVNVTINVSIDSVPMVPYKTIIIPTELIPGKTTRIPVCLEISDSYSSYYMQPSAQVLDSPDGYGYGGGFGYLKLSSNSNSNSNSKYKMKFGKAVDGHEMLIISSNVTSEQSQNGLFRASFFMSTYQTWGLPAGVQLTSTQVESVGRKKGEKIILVNDLLMTQGTGYGAQSNLPQLVSFDVSPSSWYLLEVQNYPFAPVYLFVDADGGMYMQTQRSLENMPDDSQPNRDPVQYYLAKVIGFIFTIFFGF